MNNFTRNTIVLAVLWLLSAGAGYYMLQIKQPEEIARVKKEVDLQRLLQADIASLTSQEQSAQEVANEVVQKWNARYKVIPDTLTNRGVMHHLQSLMDKGFEALDYTFTGTRRAPEYSIMTFNVEGLAFYRSLYRFIWEIENGDQLFAIRNLTLTRETKKHTDPKTEAATQEIMVRFTLTLDAYFGGMEGVSAQPDKEHVIPFEMLPAMEPASNPFFPTILEEPPPNTRLLPDIEHDELIAITGGTAVFRRSTDGKIFNLRVGSEVYLGRIDEVDPQRGIVAANLNRGGIVDRVIRRLLDNVTESTTIGIRRSEK